MVHVRLTETVRILRHVEIIFKSKII
uniref:Uncharacterized protein n=1 Tax=Arundo donax TaxID=35708 RepID=A0A0A9E1X9_ARUDO